MKVSIIGEYGYEQAMLGISLSFNSKIERAKVIAPRLAHQQGGHNKFLESMMLWLDTTFTRNIWQEADTYRIATKNSESTMHTLSRQPLTQDDFESKIPEAYITYLNTLISIYNRNKSYANLKMLKDSLPEGFLQRRIWCMSYKTFQNMYHQRFNHKMEVWKDFLTIVLDNMEHPEFIVKPEEENAKKS